MIEDFLAWAHLTNLTADQIKILVAKTQSNLIFIAYLLTIRKSYLFGAAFLLSDVVSMIGFVPSGLSRELYGLAYYCALCLTWLSVAGLHIYRTNNKNTLTACATMILFLLAMAMDSYINAYTETFIWRNYANIIVCIHVCIIVSLYWRGFIFAGMVDKFSNLLAIFRSNVAHSYFWYTVKNICNGEK
jgi:hypothetical protein